MVTKRERIEYDGLEVYIEPAEEKPFYLTGESPSFRLVIENRTPDRRYGMMVLIWRLGNVTTVRIIRFELGPLQRGEYDVVREWLYCEGTGRYDLIVMPGRPEDYAGVPDNRILQDPNLRRYLIHPLCSYYVKDKDLYLYEEDYRKTIRKYSRITIGLTILNLIILTVTTIARFN